MSAPQSRTVLRHRFLIAAALALLLVAGVVFQAVASTTGTPPFVRTVIVSPASDPLASGKNLLGALAGITDATQSNPYLVKIEPGA